MKAEAAIARVLQTDGLPLTALERYYRVSESELIGEHLKRYPKF